MLALLLALVPLIIAPHLFFYFDVVPRLAFLLILVAALLLMRRSLVVGRWFGWIAALQSLSLVVSSIFSSHPGLSVGGSTWRRYGLITQLALLTVSLLFASSRPQLRACLRGLTLCGLIAAVYGILQYFGVDPILDKSLYHIGEGVWTIVRPPATLGHADYFGVYLLAVVFAAVALRIVEENRWWNIVAAAAIPVASIAIVLSGTRAAVLGLVAGGICCAWMMNRRHVAILFLLAIGLGAFYVSPFGERLRARVRWSSEDSRGGARLLLWRDSLRMAAQHPAMGYGPETFSGEFPAFQSLELARAFPDFYHESPHNVVLDALVAQGVPGALLLLAMIFLGVISAMRATDRRLATILLAGFAALIVSQQFFAFTVSTALCFYFFLGALVSLSPGQEIKMVPGVWRPIAAAAACVLLIYVPRLMAADYSFAEVVRKITANDIRAATAGYENTRSWLPPGPAPDLYYSRAMAAAITRVPDPLSSVQAWQQALESGIRAVETSGEPSNASYNLASLYARRNDAAGVESSLRTAIAKAPNWFKPHWALAKLLLAQGRIPEAEVEALAASDRSGGQNQEVLDTLRQVRRLSKTDK